MFCSNDPSSSIPFAASLTFNIKKNYKNIHMIKFFCFFVTFNKQLNSVTKKAVLIKMTDSSRSTQIYENYSSMMTI